MIRSLPAAVGEAIINRAAGLFILLIPIDVIDPGIHLRHPELGPAA
jgi:hypothetical protein